MERLGFIHDKLDIKILILFILQRFPRVLDSDLLTQIILKSDDGIDYFDYIACLTELTESGHITESSEGYAITEKGTRNVTEIESSLPFTVRANAMAALSPIVSAMKRDSLIKSSVDRDNDGSLHLNLSLSDGLGDILSLRLVVSAPEQAAKIEERFRKNAETHYQKIMDILLTD